VANKIKFKIKEAKKKNILVNLIIKQTGGKKLMKLEREKIT
jgi:hypothetical protein